MKHVKRHPILALLVVIGTLVSPGFSQAMILTDSKTFDGFSVTYDSDVWGGLKFPHEADSYSQTLPVAQFGYGRFFFDPAFRVSSDGTSGPSELRVTGEITLTAKSGWGLYNANFTQSGQWASSGSGTVDVGSSFVDIVAPNTQFFYTNHQAFAKPLTQNSGMTNGYYYVIGERSSFSRLDQLTIRYDLLLKAQVLNQLGSAKLFSDSSNPSFLGTLGPYPASNIVGTFVSVGYERIATTTVPIPTTIWLFGSGLLGLAGFARKRVSAQT